MNDDDGEDAYTATLFRRFMRSDYEMDWPVLEYSPPEPSPSPTIREPRYTPEEAAARYPKGLETVILKGGQEIKAHARGTCAAYYCCVHYVSGHHMNQWDQVWISSEQRMYRICPDHTFEHPDPDDLIQGNPQDARCHCACRCCQRPYDINSEI